MQKKQKSKKLNNNGMTLVEVIVAMTLLTIVIVPVLQGITASMYYNAKARNRHNVTLEAETIMETFKGYDLKSLGDMFSSGSGITNIDVADTGGYHAPDNMDADNLIFKINDMKTEDGRLYDVEIKADKTVQLKDILEFDKADATKDAIFIGNSDYDTGVWELAKENFKNNQFSISNGFRDRLKAAIDAQEGDSTWLMATDIEMVLSKLDMSKLVLKEKETVYTIKQEGGVNKAVAKVIYRYCIENLPYYGKDLDGDAEEEDEDEKFLFSYPADDSDNDGNYEIPSLIEIEVTLNSDDAQFYNLPVEAGLERVFIYYYPSYDDIVPKDIIKIDNQTGLDLECYLLKQRLPGVSDAILDGKESSYTPTVSCTGGTVTLLHNFKDNIADDTEIALPAGVSEGSFSEAIDYTDDIKAIVDGNVQMAKIVRKNKSLIYNLQITINDKVTGDEVAKLEGTMIEKNKE